MSADKSSSGVRSVRVALDILEAVAFSEQAIGVSEIAAGLGLAKGAAFRHLHTLVDRGYVVRDSMTARYQIGLKFQLLSQFGPNGNNLIFAADGPMADLRDAVDETVVLSSLERTGPRVLVTKRSNSPVEIGVRPGSSLQFDSSAQGRVMLAFGPPALFERFQQSCPDKQRAKAIGQDVRRARRNGWLYTPGEVVSGINALAAPIFDATAACVGTIAIVGLFNVTLRDQKFVSALLKAAGRVSINLGNRNSGKAEARPPVPDLIPRRRLLRVPS
jgi:DNA-binding IclR family transcriptional regulator